MIVFLQHELGFIEFCFKYGLECSEIYIASGVVIFGTLSGEIEEEMTTMRLHSSLDEEFELESFLFTLGVSIIPMGGLFVIFVHTIVTTLYNHCFLENK